MVITVVLILGSLLSLVHAPHLHGRDHGEASTVGSVMTRANVSDIMSDVPNSDMIDCPSPEWNLPKPDADATPLDIVCLAAWQSAAGELASVVVPHLVIPVARGPDLQAVLQRFTL